MQVQTQASLKGFLVEALASGGHLNGCKLHLADAMPDPNPSMVPADFTESSFAGYAAQSLTFNAPYYGLDGLGQVDSNTFTFVPSGVLTTPATILGWYLTNTAGTVVYYAEKFANPKILVDTLSAIVGVLQFGIRQDGLGFNDLNP